MAITGKGLISMIVFNGINGINGINDSPINPISPINPSIKQPGLMDSWQSKKEIEATAKQKHQFKASMPPRKAHRPLDNESEVFLKRKAHDVKIYDVFDKSRNYKLLIIKA
jgi:hypothetical protein